MGRPPTYSTEALLDHAADLFAAGGARALSMSALARAAGAPNGSVYHRFPDRPALLAALWQHTEEAFRRDYLDALGDGETADDAVRAAVRVVDWCGEHPASAAVLQAGMNAFEPEYWSAAARSEYERLSRRRSADIRAVVRRIADRTAIPRDQVAFALFDLPLAAVRPYLLTGARVPARTGIMVRDLTRAILTRCR